MPAEKNLIVRIGEKEKEAFRTAAGADGFQTPGGKPNLSAWILHLARSAVRRQKRRQDARETRLAGK